MKRSLLLMLCLSMQAGNQESLLNQTVYYAVKPFVSARDVSIAAFSYVFSGMQWLYEHTIGWVWYKFSGVKAESVSSGGGGSSAVSRKRQSLPCVASASKKPKLSQEAKGVAGAQNSTKTESVLSDDRAAEAGRVSEVASQQPEPSLPEAEGVTVSQNFTNPESVPSDDRAAEAGGGNEVAYQNSESSLRNALSNVHCGLSDQSFGIVKILWPSLTFQDRQSAKQSIKPYSFLSGCIINFCKDEQKKALISDASKVYEALNSNNEIKGSLEFLEIECRDWLSSSVVKDINKCMSSIRYRWERLAVWYKVTDEIDKCINKVPHLSLSQTQIIIELNIAYIICKTILQDDLYSDVRSHFNPSHTTFTELSNIMFNLNVIMFERAYKAKDFKKCMEISDKHQNDMILKEYIYMKLGYSILCSEHRIISCDRFLSERKNRLQQGVMKLVQEYNMNDLLSIYNILRVTKRSVQLGAPDLYSQFNKTDVGQSYSSLIIGPVGIDVLRNLRDAIESAENNEAGRSAINQVMMLTDVQFKNFPLILCEIDDEKFAEYQCAMMRSLGNKIERFQ